MSKKCIYIIKYWTEGVHISLNTFELYQYFNLQEERFFEMVLNVCYSGSQLEPGTTTIFAIKNMFVARFSHK